MDRRETVRDHHRRVEDFDNPRRHPRDWVRKGFTLVITMMGIEALVTMGIAQHQIAAVKRAEAGASARI